MEIKKKTVKHYNDWPNTQGFHVKYEERLPVELKVEGDIPSYTAGTLFRTGLGTRDVESDNGKTFRANHWFDSFAQVHRFQIHSPTTIGETVRVTYNSRSTCDGLKEKIKKTGRTDLVTFGAKYDPCMSIFQKLASSFQPTAVPTKPDQISNSVTLSVNFPGLSRTGTKKKESHEKQIVNTLCNKTDNSFFQMLDPETLEPIGVTSQETLHPDLKGPMSATHARSDPNTGDIYNYNLQFTKGKGTYRVFHVSASTAKTSILATLTADPAYVHSLFLTKQFVVLCVWNSVYALGGAKILWNLNIADSLAPYDSNRRCKWYVIDRKPVEEGGQGHVATYDSDPFFCFHTVNAYEQTNANGDFEIVADLVTYSDLNIIKRLYIENLLSDSPKAAEYSRSSDNLPEMRRFILPSIPLPQSEETKSQTEVPALKAVSVFKASKASSPELPTLNPNRVGKKHRYVYGLIWTGNSTLHDGLAKYDIETHTTKTWISQGQTPGEPIFIPEPHASEDEEDAGVLLSVVLDGHLGKSYLLVLDAKDMTEKGKAHVDGAIGFGFHGTYVPRTTIPGVERGTVEF